MAPPAFRRLMPVSIPRLPTAILPASFASGEESLGQTIPLSTLGLCTKIAEKTSRKGAKTPRRGGKNQEGLSRLDPFSRLLGVFAPLREVFSSLLTSRNFCAKPDARQARFYRDKNGQWFVEHNASVNGLWLRIKTITLDRGCFFRLGEQRCLFRMCH
jgi:hypothetical protein